MRIFAAEAGSVFGAGSFGFTTGFLGAGFFAICRLFDDVSLTRCWLCGPIPFAFRQCPGLSILRRVIGRARGNITTEWVEQFGLSAAITHA